MNGKVAKEIFSALALYQDAKSFLKSNSWAAQVAVLVENSPFLESSQQTESEMGLEGIGVSRINWR